jgi:acetyl-CoA carboxylase biotin carboxyl carrier protein
MPDKKGLDLELLKEVIQIMKDDDLSEVCIEQNDMKIQVKRTSDQPNVVLVTQGAAALTAPAETERALEAENTPGGLKIISAPMVGVFYRAASPDAAPYVDIGDHIETGQVICVIEAMKLMNEITADLDGTIEEILVEDGQPVEYDQPLFRVRPG